MHIPSQMLNGAICPVSAAVSAAVIGGACYFACREKSKVSAGDFAMTSALIFAGQMINFPIYSGVSGHLLGGVLAASLLGTPMGILCIALVVAVQSIVFADGGLSVLGANIFNMAVIGAGLGGLLRSVPADRLKLNRSLATFSAAWLSVVLASVAVSAELTISGTAPLLTSLLPLVAVHSAIGICEALITLAVVSGRRVETGTAGKLALPAGVITGLALLSAPFACAWPDGLEYIAERLNFLPEMQKPSFVSVMPDYTVPFMGETFLSTLVAGIAGAVIVAAFAFGICRLLSGRKNVSA